MDVIDTAALQALPIFPLPNIVLFPGALLPLHVFEPRYRTMTEDVLAGNQLLAVTQLKPGYSEQEYLASPPVFDVAGIGTVVASDKLADGRYYMVLRGLGRIRIDSELGDSPSYRKVSARLLHDETVSASELDISHQQLIALCDRLSIAVKSDTDHELGKLARSTTEPGACADMVAAALVDDPGERQELIEQLNPLTRLERVSEFVARLIGEIDPDRELLN